MKRPSFRFLADVWFENKDLRLCSSSARGFWIDLLALMCGAGGYLTRNGRPLSDTDVATLTGHQVRDIKKWMAELGANGIYSVDEHGRMYSSRMVKDAGFIEKAVQAGQRGQVRKKEKSASDKSEVTLEVFAEKRILGREKKPKNKKAEINPNAGYPAFGGQALNTPQYDDPQGRILAAVEKSFSKTRPWWETPAGWAKTGQQQAISPKPNEDIEEFKYRVCERLGDGPHVEALPAHLKKRLRAKIEKEADMMKQAGPK